MQANYKFSNELRNGHEIDKQQNPFYKKFAPKTLPILKWIQWFLCLKFYIFMYT